MAQPSSGLTAARFPTCHLLAIASFPGVVLVKRPTLPAGRPSETKTNPSPTMPPCRCGGREQQHTTTAGHRGGRRLDALPAGPIAEGVQNRKAIRRAQSLPAAACCCLLACCAAAAVVRGAAEIALRCARPISSPQQSRRSSVSSVSGRSSRRRCRPGHTT